MKTIVLLYRESKPNVHSPSNSRGFLNKHLCSFFDKEPQKKGWGSWLHKPDGWKMGSSGLSLLPGLRLFSFESIKSYLKNFKSFWNCWGFCMELALFLYLQCTWLDLKGVWCSFIVLYRGIFFCSLRWFPTFFSGFLSVF